MHEGKACALKPLGPNGRVSVCNLPSFLEARVHYCADAPPTHWLVNLRDHVLVLVRFVFEVAIGDAVFNETAPDSVLTVTPMMGEGGTRQCARSRATKIQWMRKLIDIKGSREAFLFQGRDHLFN